ncbi:MAG: DUF4276 family protein [Acidobacteria bacterium]|nr:DUF4276 family protein [Acidobacteriota bacterium]
MSRLLVHVEGQTEESFVNEVLAPHLSHHGYYSVSARIVGNPRARRGGIRAWPEVKREIAGHLRNDSGCLATTMIDYYGMPQSGSGAWPGRAEAQTRPAAKRAEFVEQAMLADIGEELGARFVPFVVMHEFEALLFSDCRTFAESIGKPTLGKALGTIRRQFASPEEINDSPDGAPSKRIIAIMPGYRKPLFGVIAASEIGLERIRQECRHFDTWLSKLEEPCIRDIPVRRIE